MEGQAPAAPHGPTAGRSADASATGRGYAAWTSNGCNGGGREASPSRHPPPPWIASAGAPRRSGALLAGLPRFEILIRVFMKSVHRLERE